MSRQSRLVAGFLNQIVLAIILANGALAQNVGESNSILSCVENNRASQIILTTKRRTPISAPMVSYLPGEDGEVIMTADFDGLVYLLPTRIIKIGDDSVRQRGIREIRIGQLQANPPVCRVSVITSDLRSLKALNFKATAGSLLIRWGSDAALQNTRVAAAPLPAISYQNRRANTGSGSTSGYGYSPNNDSSQSANTRFTNSASANSAYTNSYMNSPSSNFQSRQSANQGTATGAYQQNLQRYPGRANGSSIITYGNQSDSTGGQPVSPRSQKGSEITTWSSSDLLSKTTNKKKRTGWTNPENNQLASNQLDGSRTDEARIDGTRTDGSRADENRTDGSRLERNRLDANRLDGKTDALLGEYPEERPAPLISLTMDRDQSVTEQSAAVFRLNIKSEHSLTYNTFRLNNPERYVIDFANCPELLNAQLPDVQGSEFIRSVRVGQLDDLSKTRLVIDLINEPVTIKEQVQREANLLTIRLSRAIEAADTAAAQVPVPVGTTIVLDAGHGGSDPGAQRGDVQEKEITLGIIERLKRRLEARGFKITLTRADDTFVSLEDRVRITNSLQPTLFLSVHINAMESANDIHGIETYYQTEQSRALADAIHENLVTKLDAPDRAVRKAHFYVINHTPVPAVLAEVGFISNRDERDKLISSDYQTKVANALEQGVMLYLDNKLARGQTDPSRTVDTRDYNRSQSGTMQLSGKSHNTSLATRKNQFEDSTR
jgi:N-acetylmuramoyl-L-alanine amidase